MNEVEINIEDFNGFIRSIFSNSPQPPFSYRFDIPGGSVQQVSTMASVLTMGADLKYGKKLHDLSLNEIAVIRDYLLSFGWDADYHKVTMNKEVLDYHQDGKPYIKQLNINNWQFTFKLADHSLAPNASCHSQLS